ncbi:gliding motility lipoprotein GldD [Moheibacter stercoris]|uniref:Gliding motility-associated lipoprotein GldD n=1 Tax=Moheibacter stercoris TaxID=1628251 RepID=A0ABV2LSA7_9FLAO
MKYLFFILFTILLISCKEDYTIKPLGQVRLEYPEPKYESLKTDCSFTFEQSNQSQIQEKNKPCWFVLNYPKMKANIYITYFPVNSKEDLVNKIKDSEKFVQEQTTKASYIAPQEFVFEEERVYGTLFELGGDSAINLQFHATDSTNNFISGSVYFSTEPKYDSLQPAIQYLKRDVVRLIETLRWK